MPSFFSHAITGYAIRKVVGPQKAPWSLSFCAAVCAALPDIDVLGFKMGISYHDVWGHRGMTHSIAFALLIGVLVAFVLCKGKVKASPFIRYALVLFLATLSHGIFDAMTSGGLGIAFFAPFDETRYFLPWRPIQVSPLSIQAFLGEWGWRVIKSEFFYLWIPSLLIILVSRFGFNTKS